MREITPAGGRSSKMNSFHFAAPPPRQRTAAVSFSAVPLWPPPLGSSRKTRTQQQTRACTAYTVEIRQKQIVLKQKKGGGKTKQYGNTAAIRPQAARSWAAPHAHEKVSDEMNTAC